MTKGDASAVLRTCDRLQIGAKIGYAALCRFTAARILWIDKDGRARCTCPAWPQWRRCLHTIALQLHVGDETLPLQVCGTPPHPWQPAVASVSRRIASTSHKRGEDQCLDDEGASDGDSQCFDDFEGADEAAGVAVDVPAKRLRLRAKTAG